MPAAAEAQEETAAPIRRREVRFIRPTLYPKQRSAIFDPRRYSIIEASTKSGKTAGCIIWLIEEAVRGKAGQNYWWVAPVSGQAKIAFRRAIRALPSASFIAHLTEKTLTLSNGAVIWFKSADNPDNLYGEDVHAAVIDEASRSKPEAWHAVRSTLTATRGPIRIVGNVKGRKNWFYALARRAEAGDPRMGYHKITARDAVRAGILDAQEIEDAKADLPEAVFNELYNADASDDAGNPFGFAAITKCIVPALSTAPAEFYGWDLAKKHDYTVGTGLDKSGVLAVFDRFQKPWPETTEAILKTTGKKKALVDSTGVGDPILDYLQKKAMFGGESNFTGYQFTAPGKQKLMEGLAVAIQSQNVKFPDGVLKSELDQFEYQYTRTGVRYSAPEGFFDDCVCSLALAVMCRGAGDPKALYKSMSWVR